MSDAALQSLLTRMAAIAAEASAKLVQLLAGYPEGRAELTAEIRALEHSGDELLQQLRADLNAAGSEGARRDGPLALGSALDDVIDLIEETADYLVLYGIEAPMEQAQQLAATLFAATRQVELAVGCLGNASADASGFIQEIHRLENEGDRASRDAIASLFRDGIDPMVVVRWKDVFERLEQAIDATEHVADLVDELLVRGRSGARGLLRRRRA